MSLELTLSNLSLGIVDYEGKPIPAIVNGETGETEENWSFRYGLLILISNYKSEDKDKSFEGKLAVDAIGQRIYSASREGIDEIKIDTMEFELIMSSLKQMADSLPSVIVGFMNQHLQMAETMTVKETISSDEN